MWLLRFLPSLFIVASGIAWVNAKDDDDDSVKQSFSRYDADGSETLTVDEFQDKQLFDKTDSNQDGLMTLKEAHAAAKAGIFSGVRLPTPLSEPRRLTMGRPAPASNSSEDKIRQSPQLLNSRQVGVGRLIQLPKVTDIDGVSHDFLKVSHASKQTSNHASNQASKQANKQTRAFVVAMTGTGCPLCLKYAPTLAALEDHYSDKGVQFLFVNPNESETEQRILDAIKHHGFDGPYVRDLDNQLTQLMEVETTTEVFLLDGSGTLRYRGAVNDQYGLGYSLNQPRENYLSDAIDSLLSNKKIAIAATSAPGCEIYLPADATPRRQAEVTYHNRISRLLQTHCIDCHHEGGSAPFSLQSYDQVADFSQMISSVVRRGIMPPWFAVEPEQKQTDHELPHWANDPTLPEKDRQDLLTWISSGLTEGDPRDAPLPKQFSSEWEIGNPDLVVPIPDPVNVKADGFMDYIHQLASTPLTEDKWISAVEIRPTDPSVVHHVLVYSLEPGSNNWRGPDSDSGFLAAYAPGNSHQIYPKDHAKRLRAGTRLLIQLHYTPNGTKTLDRTRIGFRFSDSAPRHTVRNRGISNRRIKIPPNTRRHLETASHEVKADIQLLAMMPHMHLRGTAFRYELVYPNGEKTNLLEVPRYDFNWQLEYRLAEPLQIPKGSRFEISAWYDNSPENPANPDPDKEVTWGPQTHEEMMLGYLEFVLDNPEATSLVD